MTFGYSRDDVGKFLPDYFEKVLPHDPFSVLDHEGVGELIKIGIERGRQTPPELKIGICGEHGGEPSSVEFCHQVGLTTCRARRSGADRAAGGGAGAAQGARGVGRRGARTGLACAGRRGGDRETARGANRAGVLEAGRGRHHLRPARRGRAADLRRALRLRGAAPRAGPPGSGRRPRRRGLRAGDGEGGRLPGHLGARLPRIWSPRCRTP